MTDDTLARAENKGELHMDNEMERHEVFVDIVNDLIADDNLYITGVATVESEDYDGISRINILLSERPTTEAYDDDTV